MYRKEYTERKHVIDFLFPLALFFALAASSVALVVLASGSYSRQVHTSEDFYVSCTALSYVTEKLHQADSSDAIVAGTFDGQDAILIRQEYSCRSPGALDADVSVRQIAITVCAGQMEQPVTGFFKGKSIRGEDFPSVAGRSRNPLFDK